MRGFLSHWIFPIDHKAVGRQYLAAGFFFLFFGGALAMLIRWQLGFPGHALPWMGILAPLGMPGGHMLPDYYHMLFTMHATIMVFFAVTPMLLGGFGTYLVPLMIGAQDTAFPRLSRAAFWLYLVAGAVLLATFEIGSGAAKAGWTAYAPLSVTEPAGQTGWIFSLMLWSVSSIGLAINLITTVINHRAPGMRFFRLPMTVWGIFVAAGLLLLALPSLLVALACLWMDRAAGTHFFTAAAGGQPLLWQHLFWFFGHPEVYVLIVPAMGIVSDLLPVFSRRPLFGYRSMVGALLAIGVLSFIVWGHHMYTSGMNPFLNAVFTVSTLVISVPSAVLTFHWLATLWRGSIRLETPLLCAAAFLWMFIIGGLAGLFAACTPVDVYIHNTYFITAHLHFTMVGATLFGFLGAVYYWFPKITGRMLHETLGKIHVLATFALFNGVFYPMFILGLAGEPRWLFDPSSYPSLAALQPLQTFMSFCAFLMFIVQGLFLYNIGVSLRRGAKAPDNPWLANTLEWTTTSPPPWYNYPSCPIVYRGPYEYSCPGRSADWHPQNEPANQ